MPHPNHIDKTKAEGELTHPATLSESQEKVLIALRKLGKENHSRKIDLMKRVSYRNGEREDENDDSTSSTDKLKAKVRVPSTIKGDPKRLLKKIQTHELREFVVKDWSKGDQGAFGIELDCTTDEIKTSLVYPKAPVSLRASFLNNPGDLEFRRKSRRLINEGRERTLRSIKSSDNADRNTGNRSVQARDKFTNDIQHLIEKTVLPEKYDLLGSDAIRLDNVTWHDFSQYMYTLDPYRGQVSEAIDGYSPFGPRIRPDTDNKFISESDLPNVLDLLQNGADAEGISWIQRFRIDMIKTFRKDILAANPLDQTYPPYPRAYDILAKKIIAIVFQTGMEDILANITAIYGSMTRVQDQKAFLIWITTALTNELNNSILASYNKKRSVYFEVYMYYMGHNLSLSDAEITVAWMTVAELAQVTWQFNVLPPADPYQFRPYQEYTYNLGLRLVYRQEWRPLGIQRGEIVKTIPLGPQQVEKVSTKITRRKKITHTSETLKSLETTTEASETVKDSNEIVNEARKSFHWDLEAEASGNYGTIFSATVTSEVGGESAQRSQATSNHLSETMQKTASKMRSETKIMVSTESETSFEMTTASEIQNPNNEIPITYVYSKLQRQYEILTSLAELHQVVMVAEPLPSPEEIDYNWVSKYDWTLAKVLLDDSFRDALTSISQEVSGSIDPLLIDNLKGVMDTAIGHLGTLTSGDKHLSVTGIDIAQEAQKGYRESVKEELQRTRQNLMLDYKRARLYDHIRQNILHYMRAIWSQEDSQQRLLRYRNRGIMVELNWNPIYSSDNQEIVDWEPADNSRIVNLADLINPAGPIGYHGNYAIYFMRPEYASENVFVMLHMLKNPYLYPSIEEESDDTKRELMDPVMQGYINNFWDNIPNYEEKTKMIHFVPELRLQAHIIRDENPNFEEGDIINAISNEMFKKYYPEYRYREDESRRFLVETNNLMLDILPGAGSALESFKLAHRGVDILKAIEEKDKMQLENERRSKLLDNEKYGDPEIEKVVVVAQENSQLRDAVVGIATTTNND